MVRGLPYPIIQAAPLPTHSKPIIQLAAHQRPQGTEGGVTASLPSQHCPGGPLPRISRETGVWGGPLLRGLQGRDKQEAGGVRRELTRKGAACEIWRGWAALAGPPLLPERRGVEPTPCRPCTSAASFQPNWTSELDVVAHGTPGREAAAVFPLEERLRARSPKKPGDLSSRPWPSRSPAHPPGSEMPCAFVSQGSG